MKDGVLTRCTLTSMDNATGGYGLTDNPELAICHLDHPAQLIYWLGPSPMDRPITQRPAP